MSKPIPTEAPTILMARQPDSYLTFVRREGSLKGVYQCRCGQTTVAFLKNVRRGHTRSCGCLGRRYHVKHGMISSPEYKAWQAMKERCNKPSHPKYHRYGGRGITICERWSESFQAFYADMGPRPSSNHSLDRFPDNDGNYEPLNCRWATRTQQQHNRWNNVVIEFQGRTQVLTAWAREAGLPIMTLKYRLLHGWTLERALTTPSKPHHAKDRI